MASSDWNWVQLVFFNVIIRLNMHLTKRLSKASRSSSAFQPEAKWVRATVLHKCSWRVKAASALIWFRGISLRTVGLPRSQNNWTGLPSCYLLAQRVVVWCHSMPPPLALAQSSCWVVEFLCWRSCLIDNSICAGVITAWLIGREGTPGHCHYWHTGTTPHTHADGGD